MTNGMRVVELARRHIGEAYVFGAVAPKTDAGYRGPWDCAEFVAWCIYQAYGVVYGCRPTEPSRADAYTGYFAEDAQSRGKMVDIEEAAETPGAILLRVPATGRTGHVVISTGEGDQTIEARGRQYGVVEYQVSDRRWDYGILVPSVDYGEPEATPPSAPPPRRPRGRIRVPRNLLRHARGAAARDDVRDLQRRLRSAGVHVSRIDGVFDAETEAAVRNFQLLRGLTPDGEVGGDTAAALGIRWPGH